MNLTPEYFKVRKAGRKTTISLSMSVAGLEEVDKAANSIAMSRSAFLEACAYRVIESYKKTGEKQGNESELKRKMFEDIERAKENIV